MKQVGKGRTAQVYEYGDKVLKLFNQGYNKDWIQYEIECQRVAQEHGALVPKVFSFYEQEGRHGIIFERIHGKTLGYYLRNDFIKVKKYAKQAAKMMLRYHNIELTDELRIIDYEDQIRRVHELSTEEKHTIIEYYRTLPKGNRLCHGDFHPDNILLNNNQYVVIDWITGYIGHPGSDLCRTLLLMDTPFSRTMMPWYLRTIAWLIVRIFNKTFIQEYCKESDITKQEIDQWMPVIAAVRFLENIPYEEIWLRKIIDRELKLICRKGSR